MSDIASGQPEQAPQENVAIPVATIARRRISFVRKLFYSLVCVASILLVLELLLIVVGVSPVSQTSDPFVGFSSYVPLFKQSANGDYVTSPGKVAFFNHQSFRGTKQKDTFRIFCVGGSTTYGRPYSDRTSFAGWLRHMLPHVDPSRNYEVINAGGISFASYRVTNVMTEVAEYAPDLFIVYSGHNEFLEDRTYRNSFLGPSNLTAVSGILSQTRIFAVTHSLLGKDQSSAPKHRTILPSEVTTRLDQAVGPQDYERDETLKLQIQQHYELNMRRMIDIASHADAKILFVVPASNLKDSAPFKSQHSDTVVIANQIRFEDLYRRSETHLNSGDSGQALAAISEALEIDSGMAHGHFLHGRVLLKMNRTKEAHAAFTRAIDKDICPLRILPAMQQAVRRAASAAGIPCVNFDKLVEQNAEDGIPGNDLFLDHVHPTIRGNRLLALSIIQSLTEENWIRVAGTWNDDAVQTLTEELEESVDDSQHGIALRNLSKVLGWARKAMEARRLALQAVQLAPTDPETQFQAGIVSEAAGDIELAEEYYRRAGELDVDFHAVRLNLGVVLGKLNRLDEAAEQFQAGLRVQPDSAELLANLAMVYGLQKDFSQAEKYQLMAVEHADAASRTQMTETLLYYRQRGAAR